MGGDCTCRKKSEIFVIKALVLEGVYLNLANFRKMIGKNNWRILWAKMSKNL